MAETSQLWKVIEEWRAVLPYPPRQSQLAKRLGVTANAVSEWKWGHSKPTPDNLRALADEMEAVAGRDVYRRLLDAVNRDQGYLPSEDKGA
jgi:transcriptional regulator with XRE-family HTH domain